MSNRLIDKILVVASIVFILALIATKYNLITFIVGVILLVSLLVFYYNNKK